MLMLGQSQLCDCHANGGAGFAFNLLKMVHFELHKKKERTGELKVQ